MNSLTNEQRLQIIECCYQNACSLKKFISISSVSVGVNDDHQLSEGSPFVVIEPLLLNNMENFENFNLLEDNIDAFNCEMPAEMLERVYQNWTKRMNLLRRSRRQYLHEIIFKY